MANRTKRLLLSPGSRITAYFVLGSLCFAVMLAAFYSAVGDALAYRPDIQIPEKKEVVEPEPERYVAPAKVVYPFY